MAADETVPMRELATRWSELLIADVEPGETLSRAVQDTGSLLRAPATEDQLERAEARLGRRLPPTYREFLLVSDGAYGDLYGAATAQSESQDVAWPGTDVVGLRLLSVQDLQWLRDADPSMARIWACEERRGPATEDGEAIWPWGPMADGLSIGVDHAPGLTCLVPFEGVEEWQVWNIHKETAKAYRSFRSFLECAVFEREPITTASEVRDVIARAGAGSHAAVMRLSRVTAPDAVPLLVELLESPQPLGGGQPVLGLARIGTSEAIDALARLRPWGVERALVLAGTDRARDVLATWGCFSELALLGDDRAVELAARYTSDRSPATLVGRLQQAVDLLGRSGDRRHVQVLVPLLTADSATALTTAEALARLGAPEGREHIAALAASAGPVRRQAEQVMERLAAETAGPVLDLRPRGVTET